MGTDPFNTGTNLLGIIMIAKLKNIYKTESNYRTFFKELWVYTKIYEKAILICGFISFVVFSVLLFKEGDQNNYYMETIAGVEIVLMFLFLRLKNKAFGKELCFLGDEDQRSSRYLIFRNSVSEKKIKTTEILNVIPVVDAEISLLYNGVGPS